MIQRVQAENPQPAASASRLPGALEDLIDASRRAERERAREDPHRSRPTRASSSSPAARPASRSSSRARTTTTPTTRRPRRRCAASTRGLGAAARAADRAQPAARLPGHPGLSSSRAARSCSRPPRARTEMFALIEKHRVTHIKVVPALLIRLINDPSIARFDLSSLSSSRAAASACSPRCACRTHQLIPSAFVQENFGMSEGHAVLRAPRRPAGGASSRPAAGRSAPDDEVRLVDDEGNEVPDGEVGELTCRGPYTLRGYYGVPEYNARAVHRRRLLPLRRPDAPAPLRQLRGRGPQEGPHQPRRREDQRRGDREPDPLAPGGAERRLRAGARPEPRREDVRLRRSCKPGRALDARRAGRFPAGTRRSPSSSCPSACSICDDFPVSTFGKVSKKALAEMRRAGKMRIIRPALLSRHEEWIDCQGPYVEALAQLLEARLVGEDRGRGHRRTSPTPVSRPCLVALDLETTIDTPPVSNDYVHAMWKRHPERIIQAGARSSRRRARGDPRRPKKAIEASSA